MLLGNPDSEFSLTEIAARTRTPHPSVYREVERAELAGIVNSRKIGNTRLVQANEASPYYKGLADVLVKAFGVPALITEALGRVRSIACAYIFGSWAARYAGQPGQRPVADIDLLVLGSPDRDQLYAALESVEERLGRPVQATVRDADWLEAGSGSFHETVTSRPMLELDLGSVAKANRTSVCFERKALTPEIASLALLIAPLSIGFGDWRCVPLLRPWSGRR